MASQNPLTVSAGDMQNVGGKLAAALGRRGTTVPDFLAFLAQAENEPAIEEIARIADRMPRTATAPASPPPIVLPISAEVDLDDDPRLPSGFNLTAKGTENKKGGKATFEKRANGKLYVNGRRVVFHLSPNQQGGRSIEGHKLRKELSGGPNLNAAAKDFLRSHPEFIPDDAPNVIYFWDTIAADASGYLHVSYLYRLDSGWDEYWSWLDYDWYSDEPAARLAESVA